MGWGDFLFAERVVPPNELVPKAHGAQLWLVLFHSGWRKDVSFREGRT